MKAIKPSIKGMSNMGHMPATNANLQAGHMPRGKMPMSPKQKKAVAMSENEKNEPAGMDNDADDAPSGYSRGGKVKNC